MADGAKPDVPTTDVENETKKQNTVYFMKRLKNIGLGGGGGGYLYGLKLKQNTIDF